MYGSFLEAVLRRRRGLASQSRPAGETPNHPLPHWLNTVVVSDVGKGAREASGGIRMFPSMPRDMRSLLRSRWTIPVDATQRRVDAVEHAINVYEGLRG
jgi:hypothetical protein